MERAGFVSPNRNQLAEIGMGLLSPVAYQRRAKMGGFHNVEQNALANAANPSNMVMQGQRGVIEFPSSMTRQDRSQAVKQMAEDAAARLRQLGFDASVDHSGSAMGPSSYVKVFDPQTGRFITDPLRISDHSKGPFNSKLVHDARGPEDIDAFVKSAQDMRSLGPSDMMKQQQADQLAQAQKCGHHGWQCMNAHHRSNRPDSSCRTRSVRPLTGLQRMVRIDAAALGSAD